MIPIGQGVASGTGPGLDEMVVWEWLLEQGVASFNWSLALREGRRLRQRTAAKARRAESGPLYERAIGPHWMGRAWRSERFRGIPVGWWNRP